MTTRKQTSEALRVLATTPAGQHFRATLTTAADLLDPPDAEDTIDVRVLVRVDNVVDPDGEDHIEYTAAGWTDADETDLRDKIDEDVDANGTWSEDPRWSIVTARVPRPLPLAEVEGTVESCT